MGCWFPNLSLQLRLLFWILGPHISLFNICAWVSTGTLASACPTLNSSSLSHSCIPLPIPALLPLPFLLHVNSDTVHSLNWENWKSSFMLEKKKWHETSSFKVKMKLNILNLSALGTGDWLHGWCEKIFPLFPFLISFPSLLSDGSPLSPLNSVCPFLTPHLWSHDSSHLKCIPHISSNSIYHSRAKTPMTPSSPLYSIK